MFLCIFLSLLKLTQRMTEICNQRYSNRFQLNVNIKVNRSKIFGYVEYPNLPQSSTLLKLPGHSTLHFTNCQCGRELAHKQEKNERGSLERSFVPLEPSRTKIIVVVRDEIKRNVGPISPFVSFLLFRRSIFNPAVPFNNSLFR